MDLIFNDDLLGEEITHISKSVENESKIILDSIIDKSCQASDMTGWFDYPKNKGIQESVDIKDFVQNYDKLYDLIIVIGIGGSYLGTRAIYESLYHKYHFMIQDKIRFIPIFFAGYHICESEFVELIDLLDNSLPVINVISKSGETIETSIAFRFIYDYMQKRFKNEAKDRFIITTDQEKGSLREIAKNQNIKSSFAIPNDIGGRYSVLTNVSTLPLAMANIDIEKIQKGADNLFNSLKNTDDHIALKYSRNRFGANKINKKIEVLAYNHPKLYNFSKWWQQLFGESEGKSLKGLYPSILCYTTDLHSMGQYLQDGQKIILETFLNIKHLKDPLQLGYDRYPKISKNPFKVSDNIDYIENKFIYDINQASITATRNAHKEGEIPNQMIYIDHLDEYNIGKLIAFFQTSCAVSAFLLKLNPFDQPGVENYKNKLKYILSN